ncbi:MAG: hypothetical protein Hyperionvirus3_80 [Hyperionvirus sp.]|uniref:Uncharacterized protein n=1 Tax=Hyperionvirus sp. TaxID=2487770 RepID=A0A3G5A8W7_9VIRU|nr:MAG: hypothetical protein Hyperionvirus3_80 [Hyperionvirus sp.]
MGGKNKINSRGSTINFSPGSDTRLLNVNTNLYMSRSSGGYQSEIIAFPIPVNGYIKNLFVSSIFAAAVTGSLLSVIVHANDCQNIFTDTPLAVTTDLTNQCENTTQKILVQKGDFIGLRVRYTTGVGEGGITQIKLTYNATIEVVSTDDTFDVDECDCSKHQKGTIITYCNGGAQDIGGIPRFLTFGGGIHSSELFWTVPAPGILRNLASGITFTIPNSSSPDQSIQFLVRTAKGCTDPFTDTVLQCTIQPPPPTATVPFLVCCRTPTTAIVSVAKGDRVSLRFTLNQGTIPNVILGAGLEYVPSFIPNFIIPASVIRYNTNPTELLPNMSGSVESGMRIHYNEFSNFVAPRDGELTNLFARYIFSIDSVVRRLNPGDHIEVTVFRTKNCIFDFKPTKLTTRLFPNKFCNSNKCDTLRLRRGDIVSLVLRWVTESSSSTATIATTTNDISDTSSRLEIDQQLTQNQLAQVQSDPNPLILFSASMKFI